MSVLIEKILQEYKEALQLDHENTDAIFFILDEIGNENDMNESDFNKLCEKVGELI